MKQIKVDIFDKNLPASGVKAREKYIHARLIEAGVPVLALDPAKVFPGVKLGQLSVRPGKAEGHHIFVWHDTASDRMFSGADIHEAFQEWGRDQAQQDGKSFGELDVNSCQQSADYLISVLNERAKRA